MVGKDTQRYKSLNTSKVVFFPYDSNGKLVSTEYLRHNLTETYKYVTGYEKEFSSRESGKAKKLREWYAYIYPKNLTKFEQRKLVCMDICSNHPNIAIDEDNLYHGDTAYSYVPTADGKKSLELYAAILNSNIFWWFLKHTGDTLQGDARRTKTNYINPFPLPAEVSKKDDAAMSTLVSDLIEEKAGPARCEEVQRLEDAINAAVYQLYGLNAQEVEVIERAI
ncbi:MAG: hypothetical protein GY952_04835 [Rhodobacteraceae bacterium]|nr:hypothetical protein [Paracoccaceae bacterium]